MDLTEIRRQIVISIASDDVLVELLVLKGGNALELIHRIGERASLDLDYSIREDFDNLHEIRGRIFSALNKRFSSLGLKLFDEKLDAKPRRTIPTRGTNWGGYSVTFKLIEKTKYDDLIRNGGEKAIEGIRRDALLSDTNQGRTFSIEISKFEYCVGAQLSTIDDYDCYVYTPAMIAAEKLRAICQQMPGQRSNPTPRPRDFYDITAIVRNDTQCSFSEPSFQGLVTEMFAAKGVPLRLIGQIDSQREFHRQGWQAVENAVRGKLKPFDFYFDFVLEQCAELKILWIVDPPG
jgi:hypothetical protein